MPARTSAARARNAGAQKSTGQILFFIDADVEIPPDAIERVVGIFHANPDVQALFGSYNDHPAAPDYFSQYRNLFHHYVHQHALAEARTFWGGCGAIRREAFVRGGGFPERYRGASIEDVELGLRLSKAGERICLVKALQVKHLKKWTMGSILYTDIFQRAVPWTRLAWEQGLPADLNFKITDRISALCTWLLVGSLLAGIRWRPVWIGAMLCVVLLLAMNRKLYDFFCRKRGVAFGAGAVLMHWLYLLYSSGLFVICTVPLALAGARAKRQT
jgi:GT2 family glycosyltransferase